jgi:signal transduction histidine kinase
MSARQRFGGALGRIDTDWTWAIGTFALVLLVSVLQFGPNENGILRGITLGLTTAMLIAWARRRRRDQQEQARRAVGEERLRIARELHDVVAHHVSVMGIQAAAARRIMASRPDEAEEALRAIEGSSREATAEMQRLLGMLRGPGDDVALDQPGLLHVDVLVDHARRAGLEAELVVEGGPPGDLSSILDRSAYRIVQEAVTNAIRHAPGSRLSVVVRYLPHTVDLTITDDGRRDGRPIDGGTGGHGLIGMRERVGLFGGELQAGPKGGLGFEVHATLPTGPDGRQAGRPT